MPTINITGTVSDSSGASAPFSTSASTSAMDTITISTVTVSPDPAPPGTMRTLTVVAQSSAGLPMTATVSASGGITFTPVADQPPGTFAWTFVL